MKTLSQTASTYGKLWLSVLYKPIAVSDSVLGDIQHVVPEDRDVILVAFALLLVAIETVPL